MPSRPRQVLLVLDLAILTTLALAALAVTLRSTVHLPLWFTTLSIRSPLAPTACAGALALARATLLRRTRLIPRATITELVLGALCVASAAYWLLLLTTVCGGADSYGYISAGERLRTGALIERQPDAAWIPAANPTHALTPLGHVPGVQPGTIVPLYPLGFPALIALAGAMAPTLGPYFVPPLAGLACLVLVWHLARHWADDRLTAWLATALVAWNPVFVTYAKQPMSDVPATAWLLLSVWLAATPPGRPLLAGIAAGASFITRPGGLGAVAGVALLMAAGSPAPRRAMLRFALGAAPFALAQALLQWRLFGSPLRTGYGTLDYLYGGASAFDNIQTYAVALWQVHASIWWLAVAAGLVIATGRLAARWALPLLAASLVPYVMYLPFAHWETLRFVMPALVLLQIVAATAIANLPATRERAWWREAAALTLALATWLSAGTFMRREGVPDLMEAEQRYTRTADWLATHTPPDTLVLAAQHSGSIRHYGRRLTVRWDLLAPEDLAPVVAAAHERGRRVFVALEGAEQQRFRDRFTNALDAAPASGGRTRLLPGAQIRDIQIWEAVQREADR